MASNITDKQAHTLAVMKAIDSSEPIPHAKEESKKPHKGKLRMVPLTDPTNRWKDKFLVERMDKGVTLPTKGTPQAAGFDLYAFDKFTVFANSSTVVSTKIRVSFPANMYGRIASRSGLGFKKDIVAFPGTIDTDYRGEIKVKLFNHSNEDYVVDKPGERIAQLILCGFIQVPITEVQTGSIEELVGTTVRGSGGFGSTGNK
jgi:dUTP pyrophosphatase